MKANQRALSGPTEAGFRLNLRKRNRAKKEFTYPTHEWSLSSWRTDTNERSLPRRKPPLD